MSNIEKIRQEVERLMKETEDSQFDKGERYGLKTVLDFIDSLPDETCKDSLQVPETCKENTDSFTSLEEAANDSWVLYEYRDAPQGLYSSCYRDGFIAGAEWRKQQMMKEAVDGKVFMSFAPGHNQMVMADVDLPTNTKVKLIIVKQDDRPRD